MLSCFGCGLCVSACIEGVVDLFNFIERQLLAQNSWGTAESGVTPKIIAFLEQQTAYGSADLAELSRMTYFQNVEIIRVPTTERVETRLICF